MSSTEKPTKRKAGKSPRQIGDLLPDVLQDVVARRSGMTIDLMAAWDDLAGPDYARKTRPQKIRWPRRASQDDPFKPGTLVIACSPEKALFLQHEVGELIERVNRFFGFEAIAAIRIEQKQVGTAAETPVKRVLSETERERLEAVTKKITDPELRERIERLGKGVIGRRRT
jgi:hypothetical protein